MDQSQISISRIEEFSKKTLISATKFFRFFFFSPKYIFYQSYIGIKMDWRSCTFGFSNNGKCEKFLNGKPGFNAKDVVAKMNWYYNFLFTFFAYHYIVGFLLRLKEPTLHYKNNLFNSIYSIYTIKEVMFIM